jgi:hypothetical protein
VAKKSTAATDGSTEAFGANFARHCRYGEKANYTNHSCDPNAGFGSSPISLVAMRDVQVGEEITFDYAMSECIENMEGNDGWNCEWCILRSLSVLFVW